MTAIMPTINGLIGDVDRKQIEALKQGSITSDSNINGARVLIAKVEIVRGLYAAVAWSVILLCVSLIPLFIVVHPAFLTDLKNPPVALGPLCQIFRMVLVGIIGFCGSTALVAMVQIVQDVHLMLRHGQVDVEADLKELSSKYKLSRNDQRR